MKRKLECHLELKIETTTNCENEINPRIGKLSFGVGDKTLSFSFKNKNFQVDRDGDFLRITVKQDTLKSLSFHGKGRGKKYICEYTNYDELYNFLFLVLQTADSVKEVEMSVYDGLGFKLSGIVRLTDFNLVDTINEETINLMKVPFMKNALPQWFYFSPNL